MSVTTRGAEEVRMAEKYDAEKIEAKWQRRLNDRVRLDNWVF